MWVTASTPSCWWILLQMPHSFVNGGLWKRDDSYKRSGINEGSQVAVMYLVFFFQVYLLKDIITSNTAKDRLLLRKRSLKKMLLHRRNNLDGSFMLEFFSKIFCKWKKGCNSIKKRLGHNSFLPIFENLSKQFQNKLNTYERIFLSAKFF